MTPSYRKKLIEVALPLKAINEASAREKSIRHGHPSTLHLWWARRPLAACRAVLFASLVDDPDSDPAYRKPDGTVDEERAGFKRAELFNLIEELVQWENSNNPRVINQARAEIARCVASRKIELGELKKDTIIYDDPTSPERKRGTSHPEGPVSGAGITAWEVVLMKAVPEVVNAFLAEYAPPVLDPFCGGGSIPLEAQRLGLRAYASDLNPVPVLINKALIEIPPKFASREPVNPEWQGKSPAEKATTTWHGAQGLAEDVRYYGKWMRDEAEKRIGHLYPKVKITEEMVKERPDLKEYVGQELTVIAWLWARTVASPSPLYQGIHVPLVSGFFLSKKGGKQAWVEPVVDRPHKSYRFVVRVGTPDPEQKKTIEGGTKLGRGCRFQCLLSDTPIPEEHIKSEGQAGRLDVRMLAIVAEGTRGRVYLNADTMPEGNVKRPADLDGIDKPLANDPRNLWCLGYGLNTFDKLFTARQLVALTTFSDLVREAREKVLADARAASAAPADGKSLIDGGTGPTAYADAVATYLGFAVDRSADFWSALCAWANQPKNELVAHVFGRQALPMVWDFAEANPFSESGGNFTKNLEFVAKAVDASPKEAIPGVVRQLDATAALPLDNHVCIATDPPYYDNIGYADLSDFFYIWIRRSIGKLYPSECATLLTPKAQELIASPYRHEGDGEAAKSFFELGLGKAFHRIHDAQVPDVPMTVYYAFKQSESDESDGDEKANAVPVSTGWETMLIGLMDSGFTITGTWPVRSERPTGMKGITNALASSILLVCRPRPSNPALATRKEFMTELRQELPEALKNLQHGNIAPVDLAQAAIGPGMAVFTRYAKVIETDGSPMTVRTALGIINQVLDEVLAEQEGDFDPDTRWALAWFEQFGVNEGPFGVAETLSKAKNTAINGLVEAGVVKARGGKVQLVSRNDMGDGWDPATDRRLTVWEITQHLIRTLEKDGEGAAAALLNKLGGMAETARELAYRLYSICERNKWADEALAYNGLVIAWPELTRLARSALASTPAVQQEMF